MDKKFWTGFVVGLVSVWAYHAFVKPLPRANG